MPAALKPDKKSGKAAVLQTREQNHAAILDENQRRKAAGEPLLDVPEIIKATDTVMIAGNEALVKKDDVNVADVRIVVPGTDKASEWVKAKDVDALVDRWNEANAT